MPTATEPHKVIAPPSKGQRKSPSPPKTKVAVRSQTPITISAVGRLRASLKMTQSDFAPMLPASVRSLATLERGGLATEAMARKITEVERLIDALSEVIKREALGRWLRTPNPAFEGLKPTEVVQRGEADRLWQMIYLLRSGIAY